MLCRAKPYEGTEPYIFFSYCHGDAARVYPIIEAMAQKGCRIWYDDGIHPGDDWLDVIGNHLQHCALFIAAVTPESAQSHNCRSEMILAKDLKKPFVSVMMEDFPLSTATRLLLGTTQYLRRYDYASDAAFLEQLFTAPALSACVGAPQPLAHDPEAERKAAEEAQRKAREEAERKRKEEAQRKAKEEAERKRKEEAQRKAKEDAERKAKEEAERKAKEEAERKAKEEAERKAKEEAERKAKEEAERKAREEAERKAKEEAERKAKEEARRKVIIIDDATVHKDVIPTPVPDDDKTVMEPRVHPSLLLHPESGRIYPITSPLTTLGRSQTRCDISFPSDPHISRVHARLIALHERFYLQDAGALNGTYVNDERLEKNQVELGEFARIRLYKTELIFLSGDLAQQVQRQKSIWLLQWNGGALALSGRETILGRAGIQNPTGIPDPKVSRRHAALRPEENRILIRDLNSTNGTYLNTTRFQPEKEYPLSAGSTFRAGDTEITCLHLRLEEGENIR